MQSLIYIYIYFEVYIYIYSNCRFFPAVVRELNSQDQSKLQNYGSIKNYNSEFHAQKQSSVVYIYIHEVEKM